MFDLKAWKCKIWRMQTCFKSLIKQKMRFVCAFFFRKGSIFRVEISGCKRFLQVLPMKSGDKVDQQDTLYITWTWMANRDLCFLWSPLMTWVCEKTHILWTSKRCWCCWLRCNTNCGKGRLLPCSSNFSGKGSSWHHRWDVQGFTHPREVSTGQFHGRQTCFSQSSQRMTKIHETLCFV